MIDSKKSQLQSSLQDIDRLRASSKIVSKPWGKVLTQPPETLVTVLQKSWLVVEVSHSVINDVSIQSKLTLPKCVPEQKPLKRQVISELDSLAPEDTIIASNSSSYACSQILAGLALKKESRVLSAHTCA